MIVVGPHADVDRDVVEQHRERGVVLGLRAVRWKPLDEPGLFRRARPAPLVERTVDLDLARPPRRVRSHAPRARRLRPRSRCRRSRSWRPSAACDEGDPRSPRAVDSHDNQQVAIRISRRTCDGLRQARIGYGFIRRDVRSASSSSRTRACSSNNCVIESGSFVAAADRARRELELADMPVEQLHHALLRRAVAARPFDLEDAALRRRTAARSRPRG